MNGPINGVPYSLMKKYFPERFIGGMYFPPISQTPQDDEHQHDDDELRV